ncbi:MAG: hypothetical protein H0U19_03900, partial [Acidobacteria bacterium]|nr:hypothetical protein [Acidobacteriota bacterium]
MKLKVAAICVLVFAFAGTPAVEAAASTPRTLYTRALARERALRNTSNPTLAQLRSAVAAYEALATKHPSSGYCDNALWQASNLAFLAFDRFEQQDDKRAGLRLLRQLRTEYPSSSLVAEAREVLRQRESPAAAAAPRAAVLPLPTVITTPSAPAPPAPPRSTEARPPTAKTGSLPRFMPPVLTNAMKPVMPADVPVARTAAAPSVSIREVKRTPLADGMRVTIEMDGESTYHAERLDNPRRVFFDLRG